MKTMRIRKALIAILATGIVGTGAFLLYAGKAGTVTIPAVIEVGKEAGGTATDGDSYKPTEATGSGRIKKVTLAGNTLTIKAGKKPSSAVGDSSVTVTYSPSPANPSEENLFVTEKCTVAKLTLDYCYVMGRDARVGSYVIVAFGGSARPAGLGNVDITATPSSGTWNPSPGHGAYAPVDYENLFIMNRTDGSSAVGVGFDIRAEYAGIGISTARISVAPRYPELWILRVLRELGII